MSDGTRTRDRRDHNPELYQLSYRHRESGKDTGRGRRPNRDNGTVKLPRLLIALALLVVALAVASVFLFVAPHQDRPVRADAVVVLAGSRHVRLQKGIELVRKGIAPVLVVSRDPYFAPENRLCGSPAPFRVICFSAHPFSTRGEAEAVSRLAGSHGWLSIVVVTSRFHVFRARIIFRRCYHGSLQMVGARYSLVRLPWYVATEWAKLALAETLRRSC